MCSIAIPDRSFVGAGASGAVFGIAGILIVLLSNQAIAAPRRSNSSACAALSSSFRHQSVIGLSTMFGSFAIRIDNHAHIGGFLYGLALGVPWCRV